MACDQGSTGTNDIPTSSQNNPVNMYLPNGGPASIGTKIEMVNSGSKHIIDEPSTELGVQQSTEGGFMRLLNSNKLIMGLLVPLAFVFLGNNAKASDEAAFLGKVLAHKNVAASEAKIAEEGFIYLQKVEKTQTYRCLGCYRYDLTYEKYSDEGVETKVVRLFTSLDLMLSDVNVEVADE